MSSPPSRQTTYGASFLPDEYVQSKNEGRSGLIMLALLCVVMFGIAGAFFVTNRQWSSVKSLQGQINKEYAQEAKKIEQLKVLELQKAEMLDKADVTIALIEKVPRSILMAELINRMPADLTLTEFTLGSRKIIDSPVDKPGAKAAPRSLAGKTTKSSKGSGKQSRAKEAKAEPADDKPVERPKPPRYECSVVIIGLSQTDQEVADYTASLQHCALLDRVEFKASQDVVIKEVGLRKFRIEAMLRGAADARDIEPLHVPRLASRTPGDVFKAPGDMVKSPQDPAGDFLRRNGVKNGKKPGRVAGVDEK